MEFQLEDCESLGQGSVPLTEEVMREYLDTLDCWRLIDSRPLRLAKSFVFDDYEDAFIFVAHIKDISVQQNHHPRIVFEYDSVEVTWWTHVLKGLHRNDYIMAAKTDAMFYRLFDKT